MEGVEGVFFEEYYGAGEEFDYLFFGEEDGEGFIEFGEGDSGPGVVFEVFVFDEVVKEGFESGAPVVEGAAVMGVLEFDDESFDVIFVDGVELSGPFFVIS